MQLYHYIISRFKDTDKSSLDICHGKKINGTYTYIATDDFPYFMGCLKGTSQIDSTGEKDCPGDSSNFIVKGLVS